MHWQWGCIVLQTVFIVDVLTWGLLWPMLKANPDPERVEFFSNQLFNFTSYNQVPAQAALNLLYCNYCALMHTPDCQVVHLFVTNGGSHACPVFCSDVISDMS